MTSLRAVQSGSGKMMNPAKQRAFDDGPHSLLEYLTLCKLPSLILDLSPWPMLPEQKREGNSCWNAILVITDSAGRRDSHSLNSTRVWLSPTPAKILERAKVSSRREHFHLRGYLRPATAVNTCTWNGRESPLVRHAVINLQHGSEGQRG
jgi:hypothetical protein